MQEARLFSDYYKDLSLISITKMDIAIFTPKFSVGGGADLHVAWTVQALSEDHNVKIYTYEDPNIDELNESYGTDLSKGSFALEIIGFPKILEENLGMSLVKYHYLMRRAKRTDSDLKLSIWGEMDLGEPGIQYITFPGLAEDRINEFLDNPRVIGDQKWYHKPSFFRDAYIRMAETTSSYSEKNMKKNTTVVPSQFVKNAVKKVYNIDAKVIYPPVEADFDGKPWVDREDGFVAIGRLSKEKKFDEVIKIIKKVRRQGTTTHLHLAGSIPDTTYGDHISKLINSHDWVHFEGWLNRDELEELITNHKYGIHRMEMEPSPLVIPEMVKGGCIVFGHNSGGPVEMLNNNQHILYENNKNAVEKISRVANDQDMEQEIRRELESTKKRYSTSKYIDDFRGIIDEF